MKIRNHLDFAGAARAVNLLDPAAAQDAATKAYVDARAGGAGWVQIGSTINTTSGSSAAFTSIPTTYSDLLLVFEGIRHNSGSNQQLTLELSPDGTTWTAAWALNASGASASGTIYGALTFARYRGSAGVVLGALNDIPADNATAANNVSGSGRAWRMSAGIQALRIGVTGGAFDGGALKLFGRP